MATGGLVDGGEEEDQAALRELKEEIGLDAVMSNDEPTTDSKKVQMKRCLVFSHEPTKMHGYCYLIEGLDMEQT